MNLKALREQHIILLEAISGSRAYGLHTATSDTDYRGVFMLPRREFFGLTYTDQVNNETNDIVFYEWKKFVELLSKNNPNIMELLATPDDCLLYRHTLLEDIRAEMFLSRLCCETFAGYAMAQVRKARGLNKKILNPMDEARKGVLDFCYVPEGQGSTPVLKWLAARNMQQENCGLVNLPHMHDMYALFHSTEFPLRGIQAKDNSNDVSLSSIPKELKPVGYMSFNRDGYQRYCKDYKAYWDWVKERNEVRYENTLSHGKNYDAKNMMHTFRLLDMAAEIASQKKVNVRRTNRDFYLGIKAGEYEYDDLLKMAEERLSDIGDIYAASDLPETPDVAAIEEMMVRVREKFYGM